MSVSLSPRAGLAATSGRSPLSLPCIAFRAPLGPVPLATRGRVSTTAAPLVVVGLGPGSGGAWLPIPLSASRAPLPLPPLPLPPLLPCQSHRCQGPGEGLTGPKTCSGLGALRPLSVSPPLLSRVAPPGSCWRLVFVCVPDSAGGPLAVGTEERGLCRPGSCRTNLVATAVCHELPGEWKAGSGGRVCGSPCRPERVPEAAVLSRGPHSRLGGLGRGWKARQCQAGACVRGPGCSGRMPSATAHPTRAPAGRARAAQPAWAVLLVGWSGRRGERAALHCGAGAELLADTRPLSQGRDSLLETPPPPPPAREEVRIGRVVLRSPLEVTWELSCSSSE
nr:dnaJ homolog subfamily C member 5 isoform X1 [Desmodus rotundus]